MTDTEHEGRVAVVTGGGRGFGKAFGHAIAERGGHAVLADIDGAAGDNAAAEIRAAGGQASSFACDVSDQDQVEKLVADVVSRLGGIDILINNAGLHSAAYGQPMGALGLDKVRRLFDVNVMGVIVCTMTARSAMAGRPGACVFNISSSASYSSGGAYGVSKLAGTRPHHGVRSRTWSRRHPRKRCRSRVASDRYDSCRTVTRDAGGCEGPTNPSARRNRDRHRRSDAIPMFGPSPLRHRRDLASDRGICSMRLRLHLLLPHPVVTFLASPGGLPER